MEQHRIEFPIGDWSDDGHGKCRNYVVVSNHPVERLREAHFACTDKLGIDIGSMCSEYEEFSITEELQEKLTSLGVDPSLKDDPVRSLLRIWLELLMKTDPELVLEVEVEPDLPEIQFYGFDENGRHLQTPGYGMFE